MPHVEGVKREFTRLDVAIVPVGTPSRGIQGDLLFALWTQGFPSETGFSLPEGLTDRVEETRFLRLYAFLTGRTAS